MSFSDHKITQFTHRIADLPDQPNLPANELKARFDSSPEELRESLNAVCDEGEALTARVDQHDTQINQIAMDKFPNDTIEEKNLHLDLAAKLNAKAEQTALTTEVAARESADDALGTRLTAVEMQKCELYLGTYTGDGQDIRTIPLEFTPRAVFIIAQNGAVQAENGCVYGGMAFPDVPCVIRITNNSATAIEIVDNGFRVQNKQVMSSYMDSARTNAPNVLFLYIAIK